MEYRYDIPESFWSLFRSRNRDTYIGALLRINEEYEYNNYFLSKEACIQILADMCAGHRLRLEREETETDEDVQETAPKRILNWLLGAKWLRKVEDYTTMTTNIVLEMGYSTGLHRRALIATGVVLFVFILIINICFSLIKRGDKAS